MLPYVKSVGYDSVILYIRVSAIPILVPALSSSILGFVSGKYGAARTMVFSHLAVALGIVLVVTVPKYLPALIFGTVLHAMVEGVRIVRTGALSDLVTTQQRTSTLALHFFMSPLGAVFGPLAWLAINEFVPYYFLSAMSMLGVSVLAWTTRDLLDGSRDASRPEEENSAVAHNVHTCTSTYVPVTYGTIQCAPDIEKQNEMTCTSHSTTAQTLPDQVRSEGSGWTRDDFYVLLWFICCILPVRVSLSLQMATFQPALMEKFGWDVDSIARSYLVVTIASTIPPLIVAVLSTRMSDRTIAATGVLLKFIGAILYLPILPSSNKDGAFRLRPWQIVAGFVFAVKAAAFFTPCLQSVLTKRVRGRARRVQMMGLIWMVCKGTAAFTQISSATVLMSLLGTWHYAIVVLPYAVSAFMVLYGPSWRYVAPVSQQGNEEATQT